MTAMATIQMTIPRFTIARITDDTPDEHEYILLEMGGSERSYLVTLLFTSRHHAQLFIAEERLVDWKVDDVKIEPLVSSK